MDIDFSMTDNTDTMEIDFGDPDPLPADLAAKDAAWPDDIEWGDAEDETNIPVIQYRGLPKTRTGEQLEEGARQWQSEAYSVWLGLPDDRKRMTNKAATGSGKTRFGITVMFNWFHEQGYITGNLFNKTDEPVSIMVAPTKALVNQHRNTLRMWGLQVGRIGGGFNEVAPNKQVYITTYNSLKKVAALSHLKNRPVLLVLDECHRAGGVAALRTLRNYQGDACLLLSATPNRSDDVCIMHEMNTHHPANAPCSGGDTCKVGIQYELSLLEGIKQSRNGDDALDFSFHVVHVGMSPVEQIEYDDLSERISKKYHKCYKLVAAEAGGNPHNLFARVNMSLSYDTRTELIKYRNLCNKRKRLMNEMESRFAIAQQVLLNNIGKKYALFHETIFGIERLNGMCKDIGIHPHIYHSGLTTLPDHVFVTYPELNNAGFKRRLQQYGEESTKELKRWERSASDILLTCKSLKEGFDAPDMDGVIMMSGTNAVRSRIQTIGRVFRGAKHKDIWMFVYPSGDTNPSGDERSLYALLDETKIPHAEIKYHVNGVNPAHLS